MRVFASPKGLFRLVATEGDCAFGVWAFMLLFGYLTLLLIMFSYVQWAGGVCIFNFITLYYRRTHEVHETDDCLHVLHD